VSGPAEAFIAQVDLIQAWRRFPFLDPELPPELLDHDWPGPAASALFHACHERWHRQAQAYWEELTADSGPADPPRRPAAQAEAPALR
jgi:phenylacetic acid degradation operon negative regulatory protein